MYTVAVAGAILLAVVCVAVVLAGLRAVLLRMPSAGERRLFGVAAAAMVVWLVVSGGLAQAGVLNFAGFPPSIALVLLPPLVVSLIVLLLPVTGRILAATPPQWLIGFQVFRVAVELLLWLLHDLGIVPVQMTFEGRNWDILAGLTAPVVAYFCFVRRSWPRAVAVLWNLAACGLLVNIVTVSILSTPMPFRVFTNEPANTFIADFPFVWVPAVYVPLAYTMHFLSLRQLLARREEALPMRAGA